jgi:cell wall-associated NlpC family hydrolase
MVNVRRVLLVSIALAGLLLPSVLAQPLQATTLAQQKAAARAKAVKIRAQLDALDTRLETTIEEYNLANLKLAEVQASVEKTTRELKIARSNLEVARKTLSDRAVAMYEQRPTDILDVIFSARTFDDLASQLRTMRELGMNDTRLVDTVESYEAQVHQKRDRLVADRTEARKLVEQVKAKKASIENQMVERQRMLKGVEKEIKRIEREEAAAAARAAAAAAAAAARWGWRNPRIIPDGPAGPGHPEVIAIAQRYLGVPYVYGAADPAIGFDCSGLVMYCYGQIGIQLPHYSGYQQNMGTPVPMDALIPGDLVFIGYPVSHHVALYAGNGTVIEAPHTGDVVKYSSVGRFQYAVRL